MLKYASDIGQAALLRKQIANEFGFSCHMDASLLSHTIETLDTALLNDIRAHYHDPEKNPLPGADGDKPILAELTRFVESAGGSDPLSKIYITSEPLAGLAPTLLLFVISYAPKFVYDKNFGTLMRAKDKYPVDSAPLVVGLVTILKQFHPSVSRQFLAYSGQYVRAMVDAAFMKEAKITGLPIEALNMLLIMEQFCRFAHIPRSVLSGFVPDYIYDAITTD